MYGNRTLQKPRLISLKMIDLHSHILPVIDDGSRSLKESVQLAWAYERAGYRRVVATPHMVPGTQWMPSVDLIESLVFDLNRAIQDQGGELEVATGMEIALDPQISELLDTGGLRSLGNSTYLLIEPPFQQFPPGWEQIIFSIRAKGYAILLAHPERCMQLADNADVVDRLKNAGVFFQINLGSVSGRYGRAVARTAQAMLRQGQVHCLATDSHRVAHLDPERLQAAAHRIRETIGDENFDRIGVENPQRVLAGEPLLPISAVASTGRQRPWWRFW
jgi:protein-tyrosine phosphatase